MNLLLLKYVLPPILFLGFVVGIYAYGHHQGGIACENKHIVAQFEQDKKLKKKYEKIDSKLPSNKSDGIKFLYKYAR